VAETKHVPGNHSMRVFCNCLRFYSIFHEGKWMSLALALSFIRIQVFWSILRCSDLLPLGGILGTDL